VKTQGNGDPEVFLKFSLKGLLLSRIAARTAAGSRVSPAFPMLLVTAPDYSSHCRWGEDDGHGSQCNGKLQGGKHEGCEKETGGHASGEKREKCDE